MGTTSTKPKRDHKFVVCVTKEQYEALSKKHFAEAVTRNNLKFTISEFIVEQLFGKTPLETLPTLKVVTPIPEPEVIPEPVQEEQAVVETVPTPPQKWTKRGAPEVKEKLRKGKLCKSLFSFFDDFDKFIPSKKAELLEYDWLRSIDMVDVDIDWVTDTYLPSIGIATKAVSTKKEWVTTATPSLPTIPVGYSTHFTSNALDELSLDHDSHSEERGNTSMMDEALATLEDI